MVAVFVYPVQLEIKTTGKVFYDSHRKIKMNKVGATMVIIFMTRDIYLFLFIDKKYLNGK